MTLEEAMAELSLQMEVKRRMGNNRQANAIKLGIEALKRCQELKKYTVPANYMPLPGETLE